MEIKGRPWFQMTDYAETCKDDIKEIAPQILGIFQARYKILENYVDAGHIKAVKWLQRIGFKLDAEPIPYGVSQLPFYRFEWAAE